MTLLKTASVIFLVFGMAVFPQATYVAALTGLKTWAIIVLPALLPFFITSELLLSLGVVRCFSIWLEPIMRPLFRLPGATAIALCMGFISGTPTGAAITAGLRKEDLCTKEEGSRLLAFVNNAGPLYMLSAVGIGIFNDPRLGWLIIFSHYSFNIFFGLVLGRLAQKPFFAAPIEQKLFLRGLKALNTKNQTPFGSLLGQAIGKASKSLISVGGYIVLFSVLTKILSLVGFMDILSWVLSPLCHLAGFSPLVSKAMAHGFFEMTVGISMLAENIAPLASRVVAAGTIIAWHGLSIQAQVAGMVNDTDLNLKIYFWGRVLHSVLLFIIMPFLLPALPAWKGTEAISQINLGGPFCLWAVSLLSLVVLAAISLCWNRLRRIF